MENSFGLSVRKNQVLLFYYYSSARLNQHEFFQLDVEMLSVYQNHD